MIMGFGRALASISNPPLQINMLIFLNNERNMIFQYLIDRFRISI